MVGEPADSVRGATVAETCGGGARERQGHPSGRRRLVKCRDGKKLWLGIEARAMRASCGGRGAWQIALWQVEMDAPGSRDRRLEPAVCRSGVSRSAVCRLQFLEAGDQALIGTVAFVALIFDRAQDGAKAVEKLKEPGDHDGAGRYFPFA